MSENEQPMPFPPPPSGQPIQKCERCTVIEELAEGYRLALLEAARLVEFLVDPTTTDEQRAEIRQKAFDELPPPPFGA